MAEPAPRRSFITNSILGLLSWLLPIVPTLIATPIVLDALGAERYGLLVVLIGFISYFFTTAIGKVAAKYVAEYKASGEEEKLSAVISATLVLGVGLTMIGAALTVLLAEPIVTQVLKVEPALVYEAINGLYIALATIVAIVIGQTFQLVLQGLHRFDRYLFLANLSSVSYSLGSIAIVKLNYGVLGLLVWNFVTWTIVCVVSYVIAKRELPAFRLTFSIPRSVFRLVLAYASSIIAYQAFGNILLLFERAWIMNRFGGEAMAFYAIPMSLAMYVHLFVASLVLAMFPRVNEMLGDPAAVGQLYRRVTKVVLAIAAFSFASAAAAGPLFLMVWLGEAESARSAPLLIIHTLTFSILAVQTVSWQVAEGFRAAWLNALATFAWMAIGIGLMVVLSQTSTVQGVAVGRLAGVLVFIPAILFVESRFLGRVFWQFWGLSLGRIALAGIAAYGAEMLVLASLSPTWATFFAAGGSGVAAFAFVLFVLRYFDRNELNSLRSFIRRS